MDVLLALCNARGTVVSAEELLQQCWGNIVNSDSSLHKNVAQLRRLLGDDAKNPRYIVTVPRLGYRLVAPVSAWSDEPAAADIAAAVAAVRGACPGTPIGVSTGIWITAGDVARRRELVSAWGDLPFEARPDFASVNLSENGFAELAAHLGQAGIDIEAGVWSRADVDILAAAGVPVLRVLVEIVGAPAFDAIGAADAIIQSLDDAGVTAPRLLHGEGDACWSLIAHAGRLGLATRIGLEDTLVNPDGTPATDNADLIRRALTLRGQIARKPA